jgi:hypothetical protein
MLSDGPFAKNHANERSTATTMAGFSRIHSAFNFVYSLEHKEAHI